MNVLINIDPKKAQPIYRQIVEEMIDAIKEGYLKRGEKLPSTRDLGKTLGISRFTVMRSYEDLVSAGYVKIVTGSGAYICYESDRQSSYEPPAKTNRPATRFATQSTRAALFEAMAQDTSSQSQLNYGLPSAALLPVSRWKEVLYSTTREVQTYPTSQAFADNLQHPFGSPELRRTLADYLSRARRVRADAERLIVFTSWQSAFDFALRLVCEPGDNCALESPAQPFLYRRLLADGATVHPVSVDDNGMSAHQLRAIDADLKLICISPSRNEPTGLTMSNARRQEILNVADKNNAYIIESDRDHEYRYGQKAVPSMQGMDTGDRVLYLGTVADVMAPLCRLAYLIVPEHLVGVALQIKSLIDPGYAPVDQIALTKFIQEGHFERHIKRSAEIYAERRAALIHSLTTQFGAMVQIISAGGGTNIVLRFHRSISVEMLTKAASRHDIAMINAGSYYPVDTHSDQFLFAFGHLEVETIKTSVQLLAQEVSEMTTQATNLSQNLLPSGMATVAPHGQLTF
ncbi:MAG: PLP-dependent aminotransferase family protein [Cyanobacteria bacterium REEB67]|nr:PLP-dependent aminotransferase family protein [Cyanobacteria bacterium REEB67]